MTRKRMTALALWGALLVLMAGLWGCGNPVVSTPVLNSTAIAAMTAVAAQGGLATPASAPVQSQAAAPAPTGNAQTPTVAHGQIVLPAMDPAEYSGDIITAGSSTVYPLSERMAERFQEEGFQGQITVDSIGSGAGFERFCVAGETDISNASRPIKPSEVENCRKIGREPIEFRVGTDALAVVCRRRTTLWTT